jgi:hypothetical protein
MPSSRSQRPHERHRDLGDRCSCARSQLRRDPRTIALVLVVPPVLLTLFRYVFDQQPATFDRIGGPLIGLFPFIVMFSITSIAMLRERTTGTLERIMSLPLAKLDQLAAMVWRSRSSEPRKQP